MIIENNEVILTHAEIQSTGLSSPISLPEGYLALSKQVKDDRYEIEKRRAEGNGPYSRYEEYRNIQAQVLMSKIGKQAIDRIVIDSTREELADEISAYLAIAERG